MSLLSRFFCLSFLTFSLLLPALVHAATLENPGNGSFYSGIGVISGWKCSANGPLTVRFNGGNAISLAYGNERGDTRGTCGDADNGFVAIWNYGNLGDGTHTAVVYDNGREFARSTFTVATLGEAFITGASGECIIQNFPYSGETTTFEWNQNSQGLMVTEWDEGGSGGGDGTQYVEKFCLFEVERGSNYGNNSPSYSLECKMTEWGKTLAHLTCQGLEGAITIHSPPFLRSIYTLIAEYDDWLSCRRALEALEGG